MIKISKPTCVQRYISPAATFLSSAILYQNRKAVAAGIRNLAKVFNEENKSSLRGILNEQKIILPKFHSLDLEELEHYHLSKRTTSSRLRDAADRFERDNGIKIIEKVEKKRSKRKVYFTPPQDFYKMQFSSGIPRALREMRKQPIDVEKESREEKILDQAFDLAVRYSNIKLAELGYRVRKMAEIGGGIQALVASIFMDVPPKELRWLFGRAQSRGLVELAGSVRKIVRRYQHLRDRFTFDPEELNKDKKYIYRKMTELIREARAPEILLLFFMHKL
ncbi:MAG: hypothetical protein V3T21_01465, partial [Candidatus Margulisiibacteriota bacterium]